MKKSILYTFVFVYCLAKAQLPILNGQNGESQKFLDETFVPKTTLTATQIQKQVKSDNIITFEENKGQMKDQYWRPRFDVKYYGSNKGLNYYIKENGLSYQLSKVESWSEPECEITSSNISLDKSTKTPNEISTYRIDIDWLNANKNYCIEKNKELSGYNNYYNVPEGIEPALYVKKYEDITLKNVWAGIDIRMYGTNGILETDYLVAPGVDYNQIQFEIKGAHVYIDESNSLVMKTPYGEIREGTLKVFQEEELLLANWKLTPTCTGGIVSFDIPDYNPMLALRIDPPVLVWGTYYGGEDIDVATSCRVDSFGSIYMSGNTRSFLNISSGGHQNTHAGGTVDGYLVKFNDNGIRQWATYFGGSDEDFPRSSCIDFDGYIYLAGNTRSTNNIAFGGHQNIKASLEDAFLVKFDGDGILQWGTYYGGNDSETGNSCAIDLFGNVYLAGETRSSNNIAFNGHQNTYVGGTLFNDPDAFLVKFNSAGERIWGTYYGGTGWDQGRGCAVDQFGNVYLTGNSSSSSNISFNGHQNNSAGGADAFLVKFDNDGQRLWATYYGGSQLDRGVACATDIYNNVYLAGFTQSENNISSDGHQLNIGGNQDAFLVKFDSDGQRQWGTYYGGEDNEHLSSCAVDFDGNVYISGYTNSINNISYFGHQEFLGGNDDAFMAKFNRYGERQWSTYFGGDENDYGGDCMVDNQGYVYLVGNTRSTSNIAYGGYQNEHYGATDAFLAKFYQRRVYGNIWLDLNENCIRESNEHSLHAGFSLKIDPGEYYVQTNGFWSLDSLPAGTYTATIDTTNTNWKLTCPATQTFTVVHPDSFTLASSFGFLSNYPCPSPDVSIVMPRMRRGFDSQKIYVEACNQNTATDSISDAYVELRLDENISVQSASLPYIDLGDNVFRVEVGTLFPGQCVDFNFTTTVELSAVANQTLCLEAELYPQPDCVFDSVPTPFLPPNSIVSPCNLPWDRSSVQVTGSCDGDSIRFIVQNTGSAVNGNMQCYLPVRLYIDGELVYVDSIMINGGAFVEYVFAGSGQTFRLEVDQHPLHPGNSKPNASVENCGSGTWTPGIIGSMPQNDTDPIIDIFCGQVSAPYDPNDKTGFPLGVGEINKIRTNQSIEYLIRFQNIGTDTAVNVVIQDTLSEDFNIFTVLSGVSSHPYEFSIKGQRLLEWRFNNIMLPDSTTDEPGSNGFVTFKVNQEPDLPLGAVLENTAYIYFDFEEAVITNTYTHTIGEFNYIHPCYGDYELMDTSIIACDSVEVNGNRYYSSQTVVDTIPGQFFCGKIQTTRLTVFYSVPINETITACDSVLINGVWYYNSQEVTNTYLTTSGCESIITNLIINQSITQNETITVCDSIEFNGTWYYTSQEVSTTYQTTEGCDSVVITNLVINSSVIQNEDITACDSAEINGTWYYTSQVVSNTYQTTEGCDSVVNVIINIEIPEVNIVQIENNLQVASGFIAYEWSFENTVIEGVNSNTLQPNFDGEYTVQVTDGNGCIEVATFNYVRTSLYSNSIQEYIEIYPNPSQGIFTIELFNDIQQFNISVFDISGRVIKTRKIESSNYELDLSDQANGIYFISISTEKGNYVNKLIKNQ